MCLKKIRWCSSLKQNNLNMCTKRIECQGKRNWAKLAHEGFFLSDLNLLYEKLLVYIVCHRETKAVSYALKEICYRCILNKDTV